MAKIAGHSVGGPLQTLFGPGTAAGLSDPQLLERFLSADDEARQAAFEALVTRHGAMIARVCGSILDDPHDVHDAFQASFLVLAKRARAIRQRGSLASWLYGVATRVALRCRKTVIRRRARERKTVAVARINVAERTCHLDHSAAERAESARTIVAEVNRLPEKYRAPIVLCYFEGLTHDEAATRLRWPVGTVRSRLARARDRLRVQLARRGVTTTSSPAVFGAWLSKDTAAALPRVLLSDEPQQAMIREISTSLARSVCPTAPRNAVATAAPSANARLLAQGALNSMVIKKAFVVAVSVVPLGLAAAGFGLALARQSPVGNPIVAGNKSNSSAASGGEQLKKTAQAEELNRMLSQLVEGASERYRAAKEAYGFARTELDRVIEANRQLELAELKTAKTEAERIAIMERYVDRAKEIEAIANARKQADRGTVADCLQAQYPRVEAEIDLMLARSGAHQSAALLHRVEELERKVEQLQKERSAK